MTTANASDDVVVDTVPPALEPAAVSVAVFVIAVLLATCGILAAAGFIIFNIKHRNVRLVKMGSPRINVVVLMGCCMAYISTILFGSDAFLHEDAGAAVMACRFRIWLVTYAFSLGYGGMVVKAWRVNKIFNSALTHRVVIKDKVLFYILGAMVVLDTLLLAIWQGVSPPHAVLLKQQIHQSFLEISNTEDITQVHHFYACASRHSAVWTGVFYVYKGVILVYGVFLAWTTPQSILSAMNDSGSIICAGLAICLGLLFALSAMMHVAHVPSLSCFTSVIAVWTCATILQCLLTVPKIKMWRRHAESSSPSSPQIFTPPRHNIAEDELQRLSLENMQLRHHLIQKEETMVTLRHNISSARYKLNQLLIDHNNNNMATNNDSTTIHDNTTMSNNEDKTDTVDQMKIPAADVEHVGIQMCNGTDSQHQRSRLSLQVFTEDGILQNSKKKSDTAKNSRHSSHRQLESLRCAKEYGRNSPNSSEYSQNSTEISQCSECLRTCQYQNPWDSLENAHPADSSWINKQGVCTHQLMRNGLSKLRNQAVKNHIKTATEYYQKPGAMEQFPATTVDKTLEPGLGFLSSNGIKVKPMQSTQKDKSGVSSNVSGSPGAISHSLRDRPTDCLQNDELDGHWQSERKPPESDIKPKRPTQRLAKHKHPSGIEEIRQTCESFDDSGRIVDSCNNSYSIDRPEEQSGKLGGDLTSEEQCNTDPVDTRRSSTAAGQQQSMTITSQSKNHDTDLSHTDVRITNADKTFEDADERGQNGAAREQASNDSARSRYVSRSKSTFRGRKKHKQRRVKIETFLREDRTQNNVRDESGYVAQLKTCLLGIDQDLNTAEHTSAVGADQNLVQSNSCIDFSTVPNLVSASTTDLQTVSTPVLSSTMSILNSAPNGTTDFRAVPTCKSPTLSNRANTHNLPTTELEESIITSYDLDRDSDTYSYISNCMSTSSNRKQSSISTSDNNYLGHQGMSPNENGHARSNEGTPKAQGSRSHKHHGHINTDSKSNKHQKNGKAVISRDLNGSLRNDQLYPDGQNVTRRTKRRNSRVTKKHVKSRRTKEQLTRGSADVVKRRTSTPKSEGTFV